MAEKKEVAVKESKALAIPAELSDWGDTGVNVGSDIMLPKFLIMQPTSDFVTEGRAVMGEYRNSMTCEKLGDITNGAEFIPFHVMKTLDILKATPDGKQFLWARTEPLIENVTNPGYNDNLPWDGTDEDGVAIKRVRRLNFFGLLVTELAAGGAIPYTLSFKSTSIKEGRKMLNQMYVRNKAQGLPPAAYTFNITGIKEKNEKGTFIVPQTNLGRQVTIEELRTAKHWFDQVNKNAVKYDLTDEKVVPANETASDTGDY